MMDACSSTPAARTLSVSGSWAMYQMAPSHDAIVTNATIPTNWKYDAGGQINGGLAVVDNRVFLDTLAGNVMALDLHTGKPLWSVKLDNLVMSTPIVSQDLVIVGTGRNGNGHNQQGSFVYVYAVDPANRSGFWGRDEGDHVEALDAVTGKVRWTYRTAGEDMPSPAYVAGTVIFANGDGHAYALNAASGEALWRQPLNGIATMASATAAKHTIFVSVCSHAQTKGNTIALSQEGTVLWRAPYGNCDSSPTYGDGEVFVSGVDGNRTTFGFGGHTIIAALNRANGRPLWTYRTPTAGPYTRIGSSERAIAGTYADDMYFQPIATGDELLAFDAKTGTVRWRVRTQGPVKMSPVIVDGSVYFGDTSGVFYKLRERDGTLQATRIFDKPFATSPPVLVGHTIVCANGSTVYTFQL